MRGRQLPSSSTPLGFLCHSHFRVAYLRPRHGTAAGLQDCRAGTARAQPWLRGLPAARLTCADAAWVLAPRVFENVQGRSRRPLRGWGGSVERLLLPGVVGPCPTFGAQGTRSMTASYHAITPVPPEGYA